MIRGFAALSTGAIRLNEAEMDAMLAGGAVHAQGHGMVWGTVHDASGAELREMINCLTTNKTDFFRESHHFDFLRERVLTEDVEGAFGGLHERASSRSTLVDFFRIGAPESPPADARVRARRAGSLAWGQRAG